MLWVGLHCHRLALDVFLRRWDAAAPSATIASCTGFAVADPLHLLQVDDVGLSMGLKPGMKRATGLALAPTLAMLDRDEVAEADALRQVAGWALQFSPSVSLQPPDGVLIEAAASLRLFGGLDRLLGQVRHGLEALGFRAWIGVAPTATGAWLLARWQDGGRIDHESQLATRLAGLPLERMPSTAPHREALAALGIARFGDLARLPRSGLARRFGPALLVELDRALGALPEPRRWFEAPPHFHLRLELLAQVEQAEALLFACRRMIVQLCGWLAARQLAMREACFLARHDSGRHAHEATSIALQLAQPSRDPDRLVAVLRERLAALKLPAPVHTLELDCRSVARHVGTHAELFPSSDSAGSAADAENLGRLVERLQARLGREQVQRLSIAADHRPEAAYRVQPIDGSDDAPSRRASPRTSLAGMGTAGLPDGTPGTPGTPGTAGTAGTALTGMPRPMWLLERPLPLEERDNRPWWHGPLALLAGPERIESGWWDGHLVQRDYFIAESETSGWVWIYRTRSGGWFLQGRFG
jgi:protein ImuB